MAIPLSAVQKAAYDSGIKCAIEACDVLRLMIEMKTNEELMHFMAQKYGEFNKAWKGKAQKRKLIHLLRCFILYNHEDEFRSYCARNNREIFGIDLEPEKADSSLGRFIFIQFLREELGYQPTVEFDYAR